MPQGGRYIRCDRCQKNDFSLNLPWSRDGETAAAARKAGWKVEHDPVSNTGEDVCPSCLAYDEFDDCVWTGSYCASKKAVEEMRRLAREHGLGFLFNPGGGQFTRREPKFNCQITTCDDVADLNALRKKLKDEK